LWTSSDEKTPRTELTAFGNFTAGTGFLSIKPKFSARLSATLIVFTSTIAVFGATLHQASVQKPFDMRGSQTSNGG